MKAYGVNELRRMYLDFFESKGHLKMNSFSLVPQNDKSLLLINAGMAPLKPYFTGQEIPPRRRVATCQKCIRTGDIENVGKTARHLTFFEMLGNFSFGDYFKHEAIAWSWEFLTKVIGMEADRLYPSVYGEDDEAFAIWNQEIGIPAEKITRFYRDENGDCDNFWEHGAGPCGPCSEIYYDRGAKYGCGRPECKVGCDCDRFIEVWNNVFTQFESDGNHHYTELESKNIDTGMGLERLAAVVQDVESVFDIDTMRAIRDKVCEMAHVAYRGDAQRNDGSSVQGNDGSSVQGNDGSDAQGNGKSDRHESSVQGNDGSDAQGNGKSDRHESGTQENDGKKDVSIRLITDHIRSITFMTSDGILPSNEGRGYVLRRLLRRAARHGRLLGIQGLFLARLAETVIAESKDGYPELAEKKEYILRVLTNEEEKFNKTIDQGLVILSELEENLVARKEKVLSGADAFRLYDTYGFPIDLTREILEEKGLSVDMDGFLKSMEVQKNTARNARETTNYMGADATVYDEIDVTLTSHFIGYQETCAKSVILAMTTEDAVVSELAAGENGTVITAETPFYATMGGQAGDTGAIRAGDACFLVTDTVKLKGGRIAHQGVMQSGLFCKGGEVVLEVDRKKRADTCKNHSATHLLQEALRQVLGTHVEQAGSLVTPERLRFDFTHFSAMTAQEMEKVEEIVNREIEANLPVVTAEMNLEDARKTGAKALFGEKYGETVRVVSMGEFSKELCGGTHVENTGAISVFKILSEAGVAAGVRRIEAITAGGVFAYYKNLENEFAKAAKAAKVPIGAVSGSGALAKKLEGMQEEIKQLHSENEKLKAKLANNSLGDVMNQVREIGGVKVLAAKVPEADMNGLRNLGDQLKEKIGDGVIFLASAPDGKVSLVAMATEQAIKRGAHAGNLMKEAAACVGGGGGGKPNMAQAGGKNPAGIDAAIEKAYETAAGQMA